MSKFEPYCTLYSKVMAEDAYNVFKFSCRYLHEVCLPSVVHRNFKSSNILLDEEHNPHLSDCGLAALTPNTERQASNTHLFY